MKTNFFLLFLLFPYILMAQQIADTSYKPNIENPAYEKGLGSIVFIDEGHHNFHTKDGRYLAFARLLERDGYHVQAYKGDFNKAKLKQGNILVISNALNELNIENWYLPNPSAFTKKEIEILKEWVKNGGSLFLIADHMPMAGAAEDLASAFGFEFTNGFAFDILATGPSYFKLKDQTLHSNSITNGRTYSEKVSTVTTFTGQAFRIPDDAKSILTFNDNFVNFLPDTAWVFDETTTKYNVNSWSQGAYKTHGNGRIVVFGEAAMFTAQLAGPEKFKAGMNSDMAPENYQLLLNIVHWLDGIIE